MVKSFSSSEVLRNATKFERLLKEKGFRVSFTPYDDSYQATYSVKKSSESIYFFVYCESNFVGIDDDKLKIRFSNHSSSKSGSPIFKDDHVVGYHDSPDISIDPSSDWTFLELERIIPDMEADEMLKDVLEFEKYLHKLKFREVKKNYNKSDYYRVYKKYEFPTYTSFSIDIIDLEDEIPLDIHIGNVPSSITNKMLYFSLEDAILKLNNYLKER